MAAAFPFAVVVAITVVVALPDAATQRSLRPGTARRGPRGHGEGGEALETVGDGRSGVRGQWVGSEVNGVGSGVTGMG